MSGKTAPYRLRPGFKHYEGNSQTQLAVGSIVQLTEERYLALSDRFEPVNMLSAEVVTESGTITSNPWSVFLQAANSSTLSVAIASLSDIATAVEFRTAEESGRNRPEVLAAVDARLAELAQATAAEAAEDDDEGADGEEEGNDRDEE